jgi:hypothetical protein
MANIVVKKNDTTTDVTYTAVVPSAGDSSSARWVNNSVGSAPGQKPFATMSSRNNGPKTARRVDGHYEYPSLTTSTDTGKTTVTDKAIFDISGVIPNGMTQADIDEAASQALNVFASTLFKDGFKAGYSPS